MNPEIVDCPIKDVKLIKNKIHTDERGNFIEVYREDWNLLKNIAQISRSKTNSGIIKAFHLHEKQNEVWQYLKGQARVVLYDTRKDSESFGKVFQLVLGEEIVSIYIPAGVAHGYQVIGSKTLEMLYIADTCYSYQKPDEKRIPFDDESIGVDWSIQNR